MTFWTEDRHAEAVRLRKAGLSATEIAQRMGGISRNSVIGRLHRTGHMGNVAYVRLRKPQKHKTMQPPIPYVPGPDGGVSLMLLQPHQCKWSVGFGSDGEHRFCAAQRSHASPYCASHAREAYAPAKPMRMRA